ncbi:MAG: hypothetical protein CMJ87_03595 [Planctomycetes bacterium]|nr:hypothetical protein [Planctomycetota bacterium]
MAATGTAPRSERSFLLLLLLPSLLLAWPGPGAFLAGLSQHVLAGTALALLAALPLALVVAWRGRSRTILALPLFLIAAALAFARSETGNLTDTLEADRALIALSTHLLFLLAGASLASRGGAGLARALPLLALLWLMSAAVSHLTAGNLAGALGNTGDLAEAAVPGAACGLVLWSTRSAGSRRTGLISACAFLATAAFTVFVPVHGATWALAAAALLAAAHRHSRNSSRAFTLAAMGLVLVAIPLLRLGLESQATPPTAGARVDAELPETQTKTPRTTGGLLVRTMIWRRLPSLLSEAPLLGPGPGQFSAAFPPHRDPAEIELSSHQRSLAHETAVEHLHNDWLQGLSEGGLLGGAAWILFLLVVLYRSLVPTPEEPPDRTAARCAALSILVLALSNAPLLYSPGTSPLAFAIFGWLLASEKQHPSPAAKASRLLPLGVLALLALQSPRALAILRHSSATTPQEALAACPDSAPDLARLARLEIAAGPGHAARALAAWEAVLARRPHAFDALLGAGNIHARAGDSVGARHYFKRARLVDPAHPGLLKNLITLELDAGRPRAARAPLAQLRDDGRPFRAWARAQGIRRLATGEAREGLFLLTSSGDLTGPDGEAITGGEGFYAASKEARESGDEALAEVLRSQAYRLWATEQALAGDYPTALRSLRQSLASARRAWPLAAGSAAFPTTRQMTPATPRLTMELAAALLGAQRPEEARQQLEGLSPRPQDIASLAPWAGQILLEAGLLGSEH